MDAAGDQFLTCARFAKDQHSRIGGRYPLDLLKRGFESGAVANDLLESALIVTRTARRNWLHNTQEELPEAFVVNLLNSAV